MCGFYASIGILRDDERLRRIDHRGPDGEGWAEFKTPAGDLLMGHKRLSIIDLSQLASQPMLNKNKTACLMFNGEIYNYIELRQELIDLGYEFVSHSDTEVLLYALEHWGLDALPKLVGMFAIVYYDIANQKIICARDPFGVKPLYYTSRDNKVAFASEIKQVFDLFSPEPQANAEMVLDYLVFNQTDHSDKTMFENIYQLRPGHYFELNLQDKINPIKIVPKRWYQIKKSGESIKNEENFTKQFRNIFDESIKFHIRAEAEFGAFLSGGLDSSAIVGALSKIKGGNLKTISAVFPGKAIDESEYIDEVVSKFGCISHKVNLDDFNIEDELENAIWYQDQPFGSLSIVLQYMVCKHTHSQSLKIMLDGQGADEQLAGYEGYLDYLMLKIIKRKNPFELLKFFISRKQTHGTSILSQIFAVAHLLFSKFSHNQSQNSKLFIAPPSQADFINKLIAQNNLPEVKDINSMCHLQVFATSMPMLLRYADRNSMASSVEIRVPFVYNILIEHNLSLGEDMYFDGTVSKKIMRTALADYLPEKIRNRTDKIGYSAPDGEWLNGRLNKIFNRGIDNFFLVFPNLINRDEFTKLYTDFIDNKKYNDVLWRIANLGLWAERFSVKSIAR